MQCLVKVVKEDGQGIARAEKLNLRGWRQNPNAKGQHIGGRRDCDAGPHVFQHLANSHFQRFLHILWPISLGWPTTNALPTLQHEECVVHADCQHQKGGNAEDGAKPNAGPKEEPKCGCAGQQRATTSHNGNQHLRA